MKDTKGVGTVDFTQEMGDLAVNQIKFEFSAGEYFKRNLSKDIF